MNRTEAFTATVASGVTIPAATFLINTAEALGSAVSPSNGTRVTCTRRRLRRVWWRKPRPVYQVETAADTKAVTP